MDDFFAGQAHYQQALLTPADPNEVIEVAGVVHASGAGASRFGGEEDWTFIFSLQPWRSPDGSIDYRELTIRKRVSEVEKDDLWDYIKRYDVLGMTIQMADPRTYEAKKLNAILVGSLHKISGDIELDSRAIQMQQPVTFDDKYFGTFTLDRSINWYETDTRWGAARIILYLATDNSDEIAGLLDSAKAMWKDQRAWNKRIRDFAVQELLVLKNETWLDVGEQEVTADQFKKRMTLESITLHPDGDFTFMHEDGDLFCGHAIEVSGNLTDGPTDADIPG